MTGSLTPRLFTPKQLSPSERGDLLIAHAHERKDPPPGMLYSPSDTLQLAADRAASGRTVSPVEALPLITSHLQQLGSHTTQSLRRVGTDLALFACFLDTNNVASLADATRQHALDWIAESYYTASGTWEDPALATRHRRRSAVRLYFRLARALGLSVHDPTLDIRLPPRTTLTTRPLDTDEIVLGQLASQNTLVATRLPAAWALAEAAASTSEIAAVTIADVDLDGRRVWLHHGGKSRIARWGTLTDWGHDALARRLEDITPAKPTRRVVYDGTAGPESGQAATCAAVHEVLCLSGLANERDVRPASVAAWAAREQFDATGRIEDAARVLGLRSLDRAARAIGWDWNAA